ncbi:MAG: glycine cleavage system protein GcvH [Lachnospiraceae bacterium]|nr:glycine cleavage system protein GcvH [Lachnospiraceae bacterium]
MNIPKDLLYTETHEWVKTDGDEVFVGITEYAANELGDLVYVNLAEEGAEVVKGEAFTDVESVKAVSDVNSPVSGTIAEVNEELADAPEKINEAPYDAWFIKVKDVTDKDGLMDADAYEAFLGTL